MVFRLRRTTRTILCLFLKEQIMALSTLATRALTDAIPQLMCWEMFAAALETFVLGCVEPPVAELRLQV